MKLVRVLATATIALALSACGNSIATREDAARAMQRIGAAGSSAGQKGSKLPGSGLDANFSVTVPGKTGSATVTIKAMEISTTGGMTLTEEIVYDEFSYDGENTLHGRMDLVLTMNVALGENTASASLVQTMKGEIEMTGEYDSTVSFDLTMSSNMSDLGNQSGASIKIVMDGTVTADGQTFAWDNEAVVVETVDASS